MEKNWIKQQIGLIYTGNLSIDRVIDAYNQSCSFNRDNNLIKVLSNYQYDSVLIIGTLPLYISIHLKSINKKVTILEDYTLLKLFDKQIKDLYDIDVIHLNPLFDDLSNIISQYDLIIYLETELLVPFNLLRYKHNNKLVLAVNTFEDHFRYNKNLAYCASDLIDMCDMIDVKESNKIDIKNYIFCCYSIGHCL